MKRRTIQAFALAGTAAAGLAAASAGPARADMISPFSDPAGPSASPAPAGTDPFHGGYEGSPADGVSSDGNSFIVPSATCPVDAADVFGASIYDSAGNIQAGAGVVIQCSGGTVTYLLAAQTATKITLKPGVSPGDRVVTAAAISSTNTVAKVVDETSLVRARAADGVPDASGNPSTTYRLGVFNTSGTTADYGSILFGGNQVNGEHLGQLNPTPVDNEPGADVQSSTGPVMPNATGKKFTLTFENAT